MPCRGQLASGRARDEQRGCGVLASEAGANWVLGWARIPAVAPCSCSSLRILLWLPPSRSGSEWRALRTAGAFYTALPPPPTRFPSSLLPCARPALPSPPAEPSVQAFTFTPLAHFQCHLASSAPDNRPSWSSRGD